MPTTCEIEFENNPSKVVHSGQLVRGNVHLSLTKSKTVRGIFIKIRGKAYCNWTRSAGRYRRSETGEENYLDERTYFMGGREGEVHLTPGSYNYSFQCVLPPKLPTSFEGKYGFIRYTARVVLDIPMWSNKEFEVAFTVIKSINLNENSALLAPVVRERHKTFYPCFLLFCCESDPLDIIARTPVGGYTPGQTINLQIEVKNKSNQPVSHFTVQLLKQILYLTHKDSSTFKSEIVVLAKKLTRGCDLNSEVNLRGNIVVPSTSPTDNTSNIIHVDYTILVIGSVTEGHSNPEIYLPIVIGSIPILDNPPVVPINSHPGMNYVPTTSMPTNVISHQPTAPLLDRGGNPNNVPYPNEASPSARYPTEEPPTYEEATQYENEENDFINANFIRSIGQT